jgi:hypothetical protein
MAFQGKFNGSWARIEKVYRNKLALPHRKIK